MKGLPMRWVYLNRAFSDPLTFALHEGQLGLVWGLRGVGEEVEWVVEHCLGEMGLTREDIVVVSLWNGDLLHTLEATDVKIVAMVPPVEIRWWPVLFSSARERFLCVVGQADAPPTAQAYVEVGVPYHCLPFGSDLPCVPHVGDRWDWVFIGQKHHRDNWQEYLGRLAEKTAPGRGGMVGNWVEQGEPVQLVPWSATPRIYQEAVVCPNFHNTEQKQPGIRQDVNARFFDLAACGTCQVVDWFPLVDTYFEDDEIVKAKTSEEWVEKVLWYAGHPEACISFREKSARRVQAEHTWRHRAQDLVRWVKEAT